MVIDPSQTDIADILKNNGLVCKSVLLTHGHFDHVGGCGVLFEGGAQIYCGEEEKGNIFSEEYLGIFGQYRSEKEYRPKKYYCRSVRRKKISRIIFLARAVSFIIR